ncbi:GIY-YIG nuclease family protein [Pedobacter sp. ISL-68]|uniref:GIY-YIG nuclease family protein n=1 Tax=unclassified Pedobacter TaxID=2628915 RepID=UPI001C157492|nr:GIY-YIG nuclease family protein [Pedobacter sp. ISL-64]MBT2592356.1 GIY-YIG nuclease family protein [Pedobacter sp. ISL-68]
MEFYIYILYSLTSDIYYVGYTNDYVRRLGEHNGSELATFTSKHRPWALKAVFSCGGQEVDAVRIERFIKRQKSRKLIERIIGGEILTGLLAQLVRVPYVRD